MRNMPAFDRTLLPAISSRRGMTLVETTVSLGIMAFIFGFVAFLVFMGSVNAYNVHEQVIAQSSASASTERLVSYLREARYFMPHSADGSTSEVANTLLTRLVFTVPSGTAVTTSAIAFHPGNPSATPPVNPHIRYYADASKLTYSGNLPGGPATRTFNNISKFDVELESDFRVRINVGYEYRGFAFVFARPTRPLLGQFTTDVIAKNHHLPYGPNGYDYVDAYDVPVATPVTL